MVTGHHTFGFNPDVYRNKISEAARFLKEKLPPHFQPQIAITLGSGGLGEITDQIKLVADPIPYPQIPGFPIPTVSGHEGTLLFGNLNGVPVMGLKGRKHYYEIGPIPDMVSAVREITLPVYIACALGAKTYFATNAAGGLNPSYTTGDLMIIESHIDLFFPNPLLGPQINPSQEERFQSQHMLYNKRELLKKARDLAGEKNHVHEGVYVAVTGPTFESKADSILLRRLGADAVGMSVVPEIVVASNIGMDTVGLSLITNVVKNDGTNATSHEEVMQTLQNINTKNRVKNVLLAFFKLLKEHK